MIKIPIDLGACIYLSLSVIILILWVFYERKRKVENIYTDNLWKCPICFFEYINSKDREISRCPRCKTLHRKEERC